MTRSDWVFITAISVLVLTGGGLFLSRYDVGFFGDDASFIMLAQAGAGREPALIRALPEGVSKHFLPGYPLFLKGFVSWVEPHWSRLRWTSIALSLASVWTLWALLSGWVQPYARRWATGLYALHPIFLLSSGMVMSDPFFSFLSLFSLLLLRWSLEHPQSLWRMLALGFCVLWACFTKPIGLTVALAVTLALITTKAWRALAVIGVTVWGGWGFYAIKRLAQNSTPTDYYEFLLKGLTHLASQPMGERFGGLAHLFIANYGWAWPWEMSHSYGVWGWPLVFFTFAGILIGLRRALSTNGPQASVAFAAGLIGLGQIGVMTLWTVYSERYALPLLPIGITFSILGWTELRPYLPRKITTGLLAGVLLWFLARTGQLAMETHAADRPVETKVMFQTLGWISHQTPPDSRFLGRAQIVAFYTGRGGTAFSVAPDFDSFLYFLIQNQISHILISSYAILSVKGPYEVNQAWQLATERAWIRRHPPFFETVYTNPHEKTTIYRTRIPAQFGPAYNTYREGLLDAYAQRWDSARKRFDEALGRYPNFPTALNASAVVAMAQGRDLPQAEGRLKRAVELEPSYAHAWKNLGVLLTTQGQTRQAQKAFAQAEDAVHDPAPFEVQGLK